MKLNRLTLEALYPDICPLWSSFVPENIFIDYGQVGEQTTTEELPLLGVVDELPEGMFLMSPGCWQKIRGGLWKPNYQRARILLTGEMSDSSGMKTIEDKINFKIKEFHQASEASFVKDYDGRWFAAMDSGCNNGWTQRYWKEIVCNKIVSVLHDEGIKTGDIEYTLERTPYGSDIPVKYKAVEIYVTEIKAIEDVAGKIMAHWSKLGINSNIVNLYKTMNKIILLIAAIFIFTALWALFPVRR